MHCLQNFTTEEILNKHKLRCLLINGTQKPTYEFGMIKFKNYDKHLYHLKFMQILSALIKTQILKKAKIQHFTQSMCLIL